MRENLCYCKECKLKEGIKFITIDKKDRMGIELECGHKRVYQLITSSLDYKNAGNKSILEKVE